jgi:hypothetical protein
LGLFGSSARLPVTHRRRGGREAQNMDKECDGEFPDETGGDGQPEYECGDE